MSLNIFKTPTSETSLNDRFIPRRNTPLSQELFNIQNRESPISKDIVDFTESEKDQLIYSSILEQKILNFEGQNNFFSLQNSSSKIKKTGSRFLNFGCRKENQNELNYLPGEKDLNSSIINNNVVKFIQETRKIAKIPFKILDAPGVVDDFYKVD